MSRSKKIYKQKNSSVIDFEESYLVKSIDPKQTVIFKNVYELYQNFCLNEGIKRAFTKKDFRSALESEGYLIKNSKQHANQMRIFGTKLKISN